VAIIKIAIEISINLKVENMIPSNKVLSERSAELSKMYLGKSQNPMN